MYKNIIAMVLVATLFGCVSMNVSRVQVLVGGEEICIENNDRVKSAFLDAYVRRIESKGYKTRVVSSRAGSDCEFTSTYTARYGFHWGLYLASAELIIYNKRQVVGKAKYHAPFMSMGKHGKIEGKIGKMVNELLPSV